MCGGGIVDTINRDLNTGREANTLYAMYSANLYPHNIPRLIMPSAKHREV
jgi:hypothetical protein